MAIKVLIVDHSAVARKYLKNSLSEDSKIKIVATAVDYAAAQNKINRFQPEVTLLDMDIPNSDGIAFAKQLQKTEATAIIALSSQNNESYIRKTALKKGICSVIARPKQEKYWPDVVRNIKQAIRIAPKKTKPKAKKMRNHPRISLPGFINQRVIAIGGSTGSTKAIKQIFQSVPNDIPGMVVVQHLTAELTPVYAESINKMCHLEIKLAKEGDRVKPGQVLIAPGNCHMCLASDVAGYFVTMFDGERVCYQKPAVEVLFESVAEVAGPMAVGVLLTGMGRDGAAGMLSMKKAGARTIAQNKETCAVFGMPQEAIKLGAVDKVLPIDEIAGEIIHMLQSCWRPPIRK